jgi:hypothetical protein
MAVVTPYRTTPSLGPDLWQVVHASGVWYDGSKQIPSPSTGDVEFGDDGREYMWVQASAAVPVIAAPGTQLTLTVNTTDPRMTVAPGSGGWYAPNSAAYTSGVPIAAGDRFWACKGLTP